MVLLFQKYICTFFEESLCQALVGRFCVHGATMRKLIKVGKSNVFLNNVRAISKLFRFISIISSDNGDSFYAFYCYPCGAFYYCYCCDPTDIISEKYLFLSSYLQDYNPSKNNTSTHQQEVAFFLQLLELSISRTKESINPNTYIYQTLPFFEKAFMHLLQHPFTTLKSLLSDSSELDIAYFFVFYFFSFLFFNAYKSSIEHPRHPQVKQPFSPI